MAERARRTLWPGKPCGRLAWRTRWPDTDTGRSTTTYSTNFAMEIAHRVRRRVRPGDVCRRIAASELAAVKMYFRSVDPPLAHVRQVLPDVVLATAEAAGMPIVLHLPTSLPAGVDEVRDLADRHLRLRIILAHLGGHVGQFFSPPVLAAFDLLVDVPTVFMDPPLCSTPRWCGPPSSGSGLSTSCSEQTSREPHSRRSLHAPRARPAPVCPRLSLGPRR
jgi:hypothetical protein